MLCISGDQRVLADAFDEYLATDVFDHYVKCRDINVLENATNDFISSDIVGLEFNFIHPDVEATTTLTITSGDQTSDLKAKVIGTLDSPVFEFGVENNTIQFTQPETKRVKIEDYWYEVTFIEFATAVFTINRIAKILFPLGTIAGVDELSSELVIENTDVLHVPTVIAKLDELMSETVIKHVDIPPGVFMFKLMVDEIVGEVVYEDDSLNTLPPYNITVCDV
jgi:hypothetical protein